MGGDPTIRDGSSTGNDSEPHVAVVTAALEHEHTARTATALRLLAVGAISCCILLQLVVHKLPIHWLITGLLVLLASLAGFLSVWSRPDRPVPQVASVCIGVTLSITALLAVAYLGVISSTALVLTPIVYAYANSHWRLESWTVLVVITVGYLVVAALSFFGVLPLTQSILALQKENLRALIGLTLLAELLFTVIFWSAWRARRTMLGALAEVAQVRLEAERRGALLAEAREDLRQVLDAGRLGRLSGSLVDGYRVGEVIGRGAMGEVYAATRESDSEPVAIKVLHPHLVDASDDVERFLREMRITESLDSPYVVRVVGTGRAPDGSPYLAMEWLVGSDLAAVLRERGRLSLRETVELVRQVAEALMLAAKAGVVHRDVKPQNLFRVDADGGARWKVLDFGVSRCMELTSSLTQGAIGTPNYMAPEQCRGLTVDHRADVFALGAVAYRALTGQPPFSAADHLAVAFRVVNDQPARPSDLTMLPADVDAVLAIALAKDRDRRFATASELAEAFKAASHNALSEARRAEARALLGEAPWSQPEAVAPATHARARTAFEAAPGAPPEAGRDR